MIVQKIDQAEFDRLCGNDFIYFQNGCCFYAENDNLAAFEHLENDNSFSFWKVVENENQITKEELEQVEKEKIELDSAYSELVNFITEKYPSVGVAFLEQQLLKKGAKIFRV